MSDKVQKIREEIERLKNHTLNIQKSEDGFVTSVGRGRVEAFNDILQFIDSIQEPISRDLKEEIDKCWEGWIDPNPEVKGVDGYLSKVEFSTYAHHFAEWQKEQDEKLFKDDSWNYIEENYPNISQEEKLRLYDISIKSRLAGANAIKQKMKEALQTEYEKGQFDMRERMMQNTVESVSCTFSNKSGTFLHIKNGLDTKDGDKVKIIVVKEN